MRKCELKRLVKQQRLQIEQLQWDNALLLGQVKHYREVCIECASVLRSEGRYAFKGTLVATLRSYVSDSNLVAGELQRRIAHDANMGDRSPELAKPVVAPVGDARKCTDSISTEPGWRPWLGSR